MLDRNGKEIQVGQVVEISGAYSKADNGKFLVESVYLNDGCYLKKLGAKGQLLKTPGQSWPLRSYASQWKVRLAANTHNEANATIAVICDKWEEPAVKPVSNEIRLTVNGIYKGEKYSPCGYCFDEKTSEVKIYAHNYGRNEIPREMGAVQNDTDSMTDYFDTDSLVLKPGDKWYEAVKAVAIKRQIKNLKKHIEWLKRYLERPGAAGIRQMRMDELCNCEKRLVEMTA